mgnify:CR=1 FL=1
MKHWSKLLTAALAAALCLGALAGCGNTPPAEGSAPPGGKKVVNILSCNYEEQQAAQLEWLRDKFPGAEINMTYLSSGKLAARIQAEGRSTDTDILLSLSSGYANTLKKEGLLRAYTPDTTYLQEFRDPDSVVLPNGVWAGAIMVNTNELQKLGLPEPASYEDLLNPIYKGQIVMSNPNSSSTGYFFVLGILNLYGEEAGWEYFDKLRENIMLFGESGSVPSSMVEMGEAAIGLGIDYEGLLLEEQGKPVKTLFAEEGAPYDFDTVLLVNRTAEPSDFVLEVMKAITSPEGNAVFNNYNLTVLEGGENRGSYPDNFRYLNMEGISDPEVKAGISAKWSERYE